MGINVDANFWIKNRTIYAFKYDTFDNQIYWVKAVEQILYYTYNDFYVMRKGFEYK